MNKKIQVNIIKILSKLFCFFLLRFKFYRIKIFRLHLGRI